MWERIFRDVKPEVEVTCLHCGEWRWAGEPMDFEVHLYKNHVENCKAPLIEKRTTSGALR